MKPDKIPTLQKDWSLLSRYRNILYGIAIISIMAYHHTSIYSYYPTLSRALLSDVYFRFIGSIGVEIFLFLSGISLYFAWNKNPSFSAFIRRRLKRIWIPYCLVAAAFWITEYIAFSQGTVYSFIKDICFITFFQKGENRFWFVLLILILYLLYPLIYKLLFLRDSWILLRMILLQLAIFLCILWLKDSPFFQHTQIALTRIPIFILGCYYGKKVHDSAKINFPEVLLAVLGIVLKFCTANINLNMISIRYISMLFAFSLCLLIGIVSEKIFRHKYLTMPLEACGKISLELYMTHVAFIKLFIDFGVCAVNPFAYLSILILSFLISFIICKIAPRLLTLTSSISFTDRQCMFCLFATVLFIKTVLNIDLCTPTVPSDEFNTISAAAQIMGYDWGHVYASNGYYGYTAILSYLPAFILMPFLGGSSYLLYQTILFINSLYIAFYVVVIYKILTAIGKDSFTYMQYYLLALISGFVPQLFGVSQLTQNESTYAFNHIMVVYMIILCFTVGSAKKKIIYSIACALFCCLSLAGNNRGVVIIIAVLLAIMIARIFLKTWILHPLAYGVSLLGTMLLHYGLLYPFFQSYFPEQLYNTDSGIIFQRIPRILSNWPDMKACIVAAMGWAYSFIVSTYGLGLLLIVLFLLFAKHAITKKNPLTPEESTINIVLILWFVGTTVLCIINFLDSIQGIYQFNTTITYNPERVDKLFYFRYYIALAPFGISYSLLQVKKYHSRLHSSQIALAAGIFVGIALLFHGYVSLGINGLSYAPSSTNLIGMFLQNWTDNYKYGIVNAGRFLFCTVVSASLLISLYFFLKKGRFTPWLAGFAALEIVTCVVCSGYYMGPRTQTWKNYISSDIVAAITARDDIEDVYVESYLGTAFLYQFALPEVSVYSYPNLPDAIIKSSFSPEEYAGYELILMDDSAELWVKDMEY